MTHYSSHSASDRCAACGNLLIGVYYTMLGSDDRFCHTCITTRPRCDSCGAPMVGQFWKLHDGRFHCTRCNNNAIYDIEIARALYYETVAGVITHLGLTLQSDVTFRVVDAPTLAGLRTNYVQQTNLAPPDDHIRTLGLYYRRGSERFIYLLYGLPRIIFRTTVAHEYAHAWQGEHCPMLRSYILLEGFAEWVAFYHLLWLGASKAARRMLDTPGHYQDLLNHMFRLERQLGRDGLIEYMKRAE